ncbi:MAG TPA: copper transporter [Gaiellaceae bacterium]|nr:copper transporter [Gaiellaceae bacterium]
MFDLRYHVASLAAVFFALVIGILVGVALTSHGLNNTERKKLEAELSSAQGRIADLQLAVQADNADSTFVKGAYTAVMANRLRNKHVAVLYVGPVSKSVRADVNDTLNDAGAVMIRMRAISVPINAHTIEASLAKRSALASFTVGPKRFANIGRELADEFTLGGDTPLWDALEGQLVEERVGGGKRPADAVVVVRTAQPQTGHATAQIVGNLLSELANGSVPAVGVEASGTRPSAVPTYKHVGLSSVDDVDLPIGRVALAVLLSGPGENGHYGLQSSLDDSILPDPIPPVTTSTTTGG